MSNNKDRAHFVWMECLAAAGDLSPALRLLGIRLALHKNLTTGRCFVGYETIAREIGILARSAKKLVAQLERLGWIRIKRGGGREKANAYEFTIPEALNGVRGDTVSESETVSGEALNGVRRSPKRCPATPINGVRGDTPIHLIRLNTSEDVLESESANAPTSAGALANAAPGKEDSESKIPAIVRIDGTFRALEGIWRACPHVDDVSESQRLYAAAITNTEPGIILAAAKAYVAAADEPQFISKLSNWLKGRGWEKPPRKRPRRQTNNRGGVQQRKGRVDLAHAMMDTE